MISESEHNKNDNQRIVIRLLVLVVAMFGFGYALVPLYDVFCDITGLNGKTGDRVSANSQRIIDESRTVKVTFLASLNESMPWEFKPQQQFVEVHPGQPMTIQYSAINKSNKPITGQAVPSVAPGLAAAYFQKTECFCFTQQELKPGEEKLMPVTFVVDAELPRHMNELVLSYTFFTSDKKTNSQATPIELSLNQD